MDGGGGEQGREDGVRRFAAGELTRDEVRKQTAKPEPKKAGRPKNFTWQVKDKALPFTVNLSFRKANVEKSEIADALRELLRRGGKRRKNKEKRGWAGVCPARTQFWDRHTFLWWGAGC